MKKRIYIMLTCSLIIIGLFVGIFLNKDYIISYLYKDNLKQELVTMKFLTSTEKLEATNNFENTNNKVEVLNKYQQINNRYKSFKQNENVLINPSALKSIGNYKPTLVDLKNIDPNLLTSNAASQEESQVASVVVEDLKKLVQSAQNEHMDIKVNSAYRSFEKQEIIQQQLPLLAASPGQSEHQSGLAIDFSQEGYSVFKDAPAFTWLKNNAYKFGFILSFSENNTKLTGEGFEQWHWRYITPRYASLFEQQKHKQENLTYNEFIEKNFGYEYVSSKTYSNVEQLAKENNITNLLILNNQSKVKQIGDDNINSNLQQLSEKLKNYTPVNRNYTINPSFVSSEESLTYSSFNDNELVNKFNDVLQQSVVSTIVNENLNTNNQTSLVQMCNLNNNVFEKNHSYSLNNMQGSVTYYFNKTLTSVIYLKNKGCIAINKQLDKLNNHELLKQRDLIYQLQKINKL